MPNCSDIKGPEHDCCAALLQALTRDPSLRIPPLDPAHPDAVGAGNDCPRGYKPSATTCNDHAAWCEEKIYGTDRTSKKEKNRCEKDSGRTCIFDLCQTEMGDLNAPQCSPGWKISY